jgi:3-oxoacyl-[acyl-carrier-protein] synthase II
MRLSSRRVAVTGIGLVTPLGVGIEPNWSALLDARSGIRTITRFDASDYPVRIAGEVQGYDPAAHFGRKDLRKLDPFIQYAVVAARMAAEDAGLSAPVDPPERTGVLVGTGMGGLETLESTLEVLRTRGPGRVSPFTIPKLIGNLAAGHISIEMGARGPNLGSISACATGAHSIGDAARLIAMDEVDVMFAGGSEATITPVGIAGFAAMKALSTRNDAPELASRPFDNGRDGFVAAEGAGVLVLEALDRARARGAHVYAELRGYGASADAYHMTAPQPGGVGARLAMTHAIRDAGLSPTDIDHVNAHGTSTRINDATETAALKAVFGDHAAELAVTSTKGCTGHLLGAAGAIEAAYAALAIDRGEIPPTANYTDPDPECDLDYVADGPRRRPVSAVLSSSFGFGGTNACLVLTAVGSGSAS